MPCVVCGVVIFDPTTCSKVRRLEVRKVFCTVIRNGTILTFAVVRPRSAFKTKDFSCVLAVVDLLAVWHARACSPAL